MTSARISRRNALVSITAIASTPAVGLAGKRDSVLSEINEADLVDFFAAKRRGLIATRFIPANSKRATVMMKNLTDRRLGVRLPTTFAGIPILGQFGGGGMGGGGGFFSVPEQEQPFPPAEVAPEEAALPAEQPQATAEIETAKIEIDPSQSPEAFWNAYFAGATRDPAVVRQAVRDLM